MPNFQSKAAVSDDKLRGGYYTPDPVAEYVAEWVAQSGPRLLEPSCGDGAILKHLVKRSSRVQGVELLASQADLARKYAPVKTGSFFDWFDDDQRGQWDGVAGNPPYIRFGNWPTSQRAGALDLMRRCGLVPSKLTNAWVPFVLGATLATRVAGRVGLVLPAELLQVSYAAPLREHLIANYSEVTIVTFEKLVFDGVLQEIVLLMAVRGTGPAKIKTVHAADAASLEQVELNVPAAPALLHEHEKWTKYFLEPRQISTLRSVRSGMGLSTFNNWASVDVGIVTGRNSFFTFTEAAAQSAGLVNHCIPLVSRSAQLMSSRLEAEDLAEQTSAGHRTLLLNAVPGREDSALLAHIAAGEAEGVHLGYKCSIRKPWWRTPSVWVPDAFMLRQIHRAPRITANLADATSTDTVHRVKVGLGIDPVALATVFNNSATFAFCEVMGRSYGGGILELEPREAEFLPMPSPDLATEDLKSEVDVLIRANEPDKARALVDEEILVGCLGWDDEDVFNCDEAFVALRSRRTTRGSRK